MNETISYIKEHISIKPSIAIILGSGLSGLVNHISDAVKLSYSDIPGFPVSTVEGHSGELIFGRIHDKEVIVMNGRFHYYEGYSTDEITFPVRIFSELGINRMIITNAAGGIAPDLNPGDIMLIDDHISLFMPSIFRGNIEKKKRASFVDMSEVYSLKARNLALYVAQKEGVNLKRGHYIFFEGPRYETPADIKAMAALGASSTGMSTVPETIAARYLNMEVLGLSYITNKAAGLSSNKLSHQEVIENAKISAELFVNLVKSIVKEWN